MYACNINFDGCLINAEPTWSVVLFSSSRPSRIWRGMSIKIMRSSMFSPICRTEHELLYFGSIVWYDDDESIGFRKCMIQKKSCLFETITFHDVWPASFFFFVFLFHSSAMNMIHFNWITLHTDQKNLCVTLRGEKWMQSGEKNCPAKTTVTKQQLNGLDIWWNLPFISYWPLRSLNC